jgi:hypothetical protein
MSRAPAYKVPGATTPEEFRAKSMRPIGPTAGKPPVVGPACHRSLNQSAVPSAQENSLPCPSHGGFCHGGDPALTETVQAIRVPLCAWHLPGLQGTTRSTTAFWHGKCPDGREVFRMSVAAADLLLHGAAGAQRILRPPVGGDRPVAAPRPRQAVGPRADVGHRAAAAHRAGPPAHRGGTGCIQR